MFENYPDVIGVEDVRDMLHIGRSTITRMIKNGKLPCIKVNSRKFLFRKKDVIALLDNEVAIYEQEKENSIH